MICFKIAVNRAYRTKLKQCIGCKSNDSKFLILAILIYAIIIISLHSQAKKFIFCGLGLTLLLVKDLSPPGQSPSVCSILEGWNLKPGSLV